MKCLVGFKNCRGYTQETKESNRGKRKGSLMGQTGQSARCCRAQSPKAFKTEGTEPVQSGCRLIEVKKTESGANYGVSRWQVPCVCL